MRSLAVYKRFYDRIGFPGVAVWGVRTICGALWFRFLLVFFVFAAVFGKLDDDPIWYLKNESSSFEEAFWRMCLYWSSIIYFVILFTVRNSFLRWLVILLTAATIATDQFYVYYINGDGFTPHEMFLALRNPSTVGDSIGMYWELAWPTVLISFSVVIAVGALLHRWVLTVPTRLALWGSVLFIPLGVLIGVEDYGPGGQVAMPIRLPVFTAYYALAPCVPDREAPYIAPEKEPVVDHLVLIIDESVMGSHLGINGYPRNTTPQLKSLLETGDAATLGVCSSACNYSIGSFLTVMSGTDVESMKTDYTRFLTRPTLIAYAAKAGYDVQFLNSQDYLVWSEPERGALGDRWEAISIDRNRQEPYQWDHSLLKHVERFVNEHPRSFTIIAKRGIHYPYFNKYPPDKKRFQPVLTNSAWSDDFITNINSYDNSLAWTCDDYLAELQRELKRTGKNALVIYTSDHGQILPGEPLEGHVFKRTHAMLDSPSTSVADVPLVLIATGEAKAILARLPRENQSRLSHFSIFPSLLLMMGYAEKTVHETYGPDMWQKRPANFQRVFFEGKPVQTCKPFSPPDNSKKFDMIKKFDSSRPRADE